MRSWRAELRRAGWLGADSHSDTVYCIYQWTNERNLCFGFSKVHYHTFFSHLINHVYFIYSVLGSTFLLICIRCHLLNIFVLFCGTKSSSSALLLDFCCFVSFSSIKGNHFESEIKENEKICFKVLSRLVMINFKNAVRWVLVIFLFFIMLVLLRRTSFLDTF